MQTVAQYHHINFENVSYVAYMKYVHRLGSMGLDEIG